MLNIELAERVLQHVEAHPELHHQGHWMKRTACGTTACLAGWTVLLGAPEAEIRWTEDDESDDDQVVYFGNEVVTAHERERAVEFYAAELLGVQYGTLHGIFYTEGPREAIDHFRFLIEEAKRDAAATA